MLFISLVRVGYIVFHVHVGDSYAMVYVNVVRCVFYSIIECTEVQYSTYKLVWGPQY